MRSKDNINTNLSKCNHKESLSNLPPQKKKKKETTTDECVALNSMDALLSVFRIQ